MKEIIFEVEFTDNSRFTISLDFRRFIGTFLWFCFGVLVGVTCG